MEVQGAVLVLQRAGEQPVALAAREVLLECRSAARQTDRVDHTFGPAVGAGSPPQIRSRDGPNSTSDGRRQVFGRKGCPLLRVCYTAVAEHERACLAVYLPTCLAGYLFVCMRMSVCACVCELCMRVCKCDVCA